MKKFLGILVLGLLWCNVGFGGVSREDNVNLFGIILGDDVDNYKTFFKHYSDPRCTNVTSKFFPSDCYRPNLKSYVSFRSIVTPLIKNKEYDSYSVSALFYSKKIHRISASSIRGWKDSESLLCKRRASTIKNIIATKYEKKGWTKSSAGMRLVMHKGSSSFDILAFCREIIGGFRLVITIDYFDKDMHAKDKISYIKSMDDKINTEGF